MPGPTPMNRRKDALLGAARIVELVNTIGHAHDPAACATVGMIQAYPSRAMSFPGRCSSASTSATPTTRNTLGVDGCCPSAGLPA